MPDQPTAPRRPSDEERPTLKLIRAWWRRNHTFEILPVTRQAWDELDAAIRADERALLASSPRASEPDTERAALHRDLDARFPLFRDFAEFVGSRRHTDHSMPCPCCGIHLSPEDEAGDPRASEPEHLEDTVRKLTRWMPNVDGRSMVTELDGQWLSRADMIEAVSRRPALGVPQEEGK